MRPLGYYLHRAFHTSLFVSVPIPSMETDTVSPFFSHSRLPLGLPSITPAGVPVNIRSHGSSLKKREHQLTIYAQENSMFSVLSSWTVFPFTAQLMRCGASGSKLSAFTIRGPTGAKSGSALPASH